MASTASTAAVFAVAKAPAAARVAIAARPARAHRRSAISGSRVAFSPALRMGVRRVTCMQAGAEVVDKVRTIISEQLGTDVDKVTAESKFVDLGADSLDQVEIMMALEEQFSISLDEEGAEKIATVQQAADLIASKL